MPNLDKKLLQDTFLLFRNETIDLMYTAFLILDDEDSELIFTEIVKAYRKIKYGEKGSDVSEALIAVLEGQGSYQAKWDAFVTYCENKENRYKSLRFVISETVPEMLPQIVFAKGKKVETNKIEKACEHYQQAIALAKKFNSAKIAEFKEHIRDLPQRLISVNRYDSKHIVSLYMSGIHSHRAVLLGRSIKNIAYPATDIAMRVGGFVDVYTGVLAVPVAVVTGIASTLAGSVHGFFRMATRDLLESEQIKALFDNLNQMSASDDTQKQQVITEIVRKYTETRSENCSSHSSNKLFEILKTEDKSVSDKWNALVAYMTKRFNGSGLLKSNGKRLFRIIDSAVTQHLKDQPQLQQAFTSVAV